MPIRCGFRRRRWRRARRGWTRRGEGATAERCRAEARRIECRAGRFLDGGAGPYPLAQVEGGAPEKLLECAVILAANHAARAGRTL